MSLKIDKNNCRVCMKTTDGISIYSDGVTGKKFQFCTQLEISKTDGLPKTICNKCVGRLEIAYDFRKQAEYSDKYLRQVITHVLEEVNQSAQAKRSLNDEVVEIDNTRIKVEQIEQLTDVISEQISFVNIPPTQNGIVIAETAGDKGAKQQAGKVPVCAVYEEYNAYAFDSDLVKTEEIEEEKIQETNPINLFTITEVTSIRKKKGDQTDKYECIVCGALFTRNGSLKRHSLIHSGERPYKCKICGRRFTQSNGLTAHSRIHSGDRPFKCKFCDQAFTQSNCLISHMIKHTGAKPYTCVVCDARFARNGALKRHSLIHSSEQQFKCNFCGRSFTNSSFLAAHKRQHTAGKPYSCIVCGARFKRSESLKRHSEIHLDERSYKSNLSGRGFNQSNTLASHKRRLTVGKPYTCETCGSHFRYQKTLTQHIFIKHENQKKTEVEINVVKQRERKRQPTRNGTALGKTIAEEVHYKGTERQVYTCKSNIVKTEEIEEEEIQETKPINVFTITEVNSIRKKTGAQTDKCVCMVCGALFTTNGSLKRHSLIHSGVRPYKCNLCSRRFTQSNGLVSHMKRHTGEKPYNCNICGSIFRFRTSLNRHVLKHEKLKKAEVVIID